MIKNKTILVFDSNSSMRKNFAKIIKNTDKTIDMHEATTLKSTINLACLIKPDFIFIALRLSSTKDININSCHKLIAKVPKTRILFMSAKNDEISIVSTLVSGTCNFFINNINHKYANNNVSLSLNGDVVFNEHSLSCLLNAFQERGVIKGNSHLTKLSAQQLKILGFVSLGLTNKEIGRKMNLSDNTVRNYLSTIFSKLGISKRLEAAMIYAEVTTNELDKKI